MLNAERIAKLQRELNVLERSRDTRICSETTLSQRDMENMIKAINAEIETLKAA